MGCEVRARARAERAGKQPKQHTVSRGQQPKAEARADGTIEVVKACLEQWEAATSGKSKACQQCQRKLGTPKLSDGC